MSNEPRRTYVIDASVLLADTRAVYRFKEHRVIVPLAVIPQLQAKRHHPEVGGRAFAALAQLDSLREMHGQLDAEIPVNDIGGTLKVEVNHVASGKLPPGFQTDDMSRIFLVAYNLKHEGTDVTLVSKDLATRLMASSLGIKVEDYRQIQADTVWTGIETVHVDNETLADVEEGRCRITPSDEVPVNTGFNMIIPDGTAVLTRLGRDGLVRRVDPQPLAGKQLTARNTEQLLAFDLLRDPEIGIVSLGGRAGTGKTVIAIMAGLHAIQNAQVKKIVVIRPIDPVGGADLGYLPGTQEEKMEPWSQAIYDSVANITQLEGTIRTGGLEIIPVTHARGRTYYDSFVIVDEAQSFERVVLLGLIERIGEGSRIVFTHDVDQRDNPRVGRHDGVAAVIEEYRGNPLFGHVELVDAVRSSIAASAASILRDDLPPKRQFSGDFDNQKGGFNSLRK